MISTFDCGAGVSSKVLIAGVGAVGTAIAVRAYGAGAEVSVLARGASKDAIAQRGLRLIEPSGTSWAPVKLAVPCPAIPRDVVFLCSKSHDLEGLAEAVTPFIGPATLLVPVINGIPWWYFEGIEKPSSYRNIAAVDPSGRLMTLLPSSQLIGCVALFTAERVGVGEVSCDNPIRLVIGELDGRTTQRVEYLAEILKAGNIETRVTAAIRNAVWTKVIMNLMSNPLSVVAETHLRNICCHPDLSKVTRSMRDEAISVAESLGAEIEMGPDAILAFSASLGEVRTSMLQDYHAGRPLEISAICEAVMELGALGEIRMPLTRMITSLARYKSHRTGQ